VIDEFDEMTMVADETEVYPSEIYGGGDIGGNTMHPAALFFQRGPRGIWVFHNEVVASGMGLDRFEADMRIVFATTFPGRQPGPFWSDPAGRTRDGIFETVVFDHLLAKGWPALPAPSQDIDIRIDALRAPMGRRIDGKPGILINRRCAKFIKGLSGAWHYRRMGTRGAERYAEKPEKNHPYSDICDAGGYGLSGAGETSMLKRRAERPDEVPAAAGDPRTPFASSATRIGNRPFVAKTDFDPLG